MNGLSGGYDPYTIGQQQLMMPSSLQQTDTHQYVNEAFLAGASDASGLQHVFADETTCNEAVCSHFTSVEDDSTITTAVEEEDVAEATIAVQLDQLEGTSNEEAQIEAAAEDVDEANVDAANGISSTELVAHDDHTPMTSSAEPSQSGDEPTSTDESQDGGATTSKGNGNEADGEEVSSIQTLTRTTNPSSILLCSQTTPDVTVDGSAIDAPTSNIHPEFFPQIFYPYVFGAPAPFSVPVNGKLSFFVKRSVVITSQIPTYRSSLDYRL